MSVRLFHFGIMTISELVLLMHTIFLHALKIIFVYDYCVGKYTDRDPRKGVPHFIFGPKWLKFWSKMPLATTELERTLCPETQVGPVGIGALKFMRGANVITIKAFYDKNQPLVRFVVVPFPF